jgi:translocator protein
MRRDLAAALAATGVVTAQLVGRRHSPTPDHPRTSAWYTSLHKPRVTPPGAVFGLVWTGLDTLAGYAGYRLLIAPRSGRRAAALGVWGLNLLGVGGFTWVLFGRKRLGEATAVSAAMVATALGGVVASWPVDRRAATASIPLALWVCFALGLQEEVWRRNT